MRSSRRSFAWSTCWQCGPMSFSPRGSRDGIAAATCFPAAVTTWDRDPHLVLSRACIDGHERAKRSPTWLTLLHNDGHEFTSRACVVGPVASRYGHEREKCWAARARCLPGDPNDKGSLCLRVSLTTVTRGDREAMC